MTHLTYDLDDTALVLRPHHELQKLALSLFVEREKVMESIKGKTYNGGVIVDANFRGVVVESEDRTRKMVPLSEARMRQLLAGTTSRK